jgi:GAF domain-containing protein
MSNPPVRTSTVLAPVLALARAALSQAERGVLIPRTAQEMARALRAKACEIWLADSEAPQVAAVYLEPGTVADSLDGAVLLSVVGSGSGEPVSVGDWLCVPVRGEPGVRGVLALNRAGAWHDEEVALAELAASIVAFVVALGQARTFDDRERDQFLALIGHDLRSPVSNIRVGAQLARRNLNAGAT